MTLFFFFKNLQGKYRQSHSWFYEILFSYIFYLISQIKQKNRRKYTKTAIVLLVHIDILQIVV